MGWFTGGPGAAAAGAIGPWLMPETEDFTAYVSQRADVIYVRDLLASRWGNWDDYPPMIMAEIETLFDSLMHLEYLFEQAQSIVEAARIDLKPTGVTMVRGAKKLVASPEVPLVEWKKRLSEVGRIQERRRDDSVYAVSERSISGNKKLTVK